LGTVEYKTCDRCGKRMEYIGWTARIKNAVKRGKTVKIRKYFNGNPDGYSYSDCYYELCADCTKEVEDLLSNKTRI
jgi:DNA-directed RNA polymerase subunit RPC12/RpoP